MNLIEIFLPLRDNNGKAFDPELFSLVREELVSQFDGLTTYSRAPAEGIWKEGESSSDKDEIVIYEVMTETFDESWWTVYREKLELRFKQQAILIRMSNVRVL